MQVYDEKLQRSRIKETQDISNDTWKFRISLVQQMEFVFKTCLKHR